VQTWRGRGRRRERDLGQNRKCLEYVQSRKNGGGAVTSGRGACVLQALKASTQGRGANPNPNWKNKTTARPHPQPQRCTDDHVRAGDAQTAPATTA
jgi:hypothetical protein